ncbi:MAG: transglycosylase domain-containing protein [Jatrophihabitans sp.]
MSQSPRKPVGEGRRRAASTSQPGWWRRRRTKKKQRLAAMSRRRRVWRRIALAGTWLLGLTAVLMVVAVTLFYTLTRVPEPGDLQVAQVATVTYSNGQVMAKLGSVNRINVPLAKVPESVRWAVIAAEDRGFYSESGVSIKGTLRAAVNDVTGGDTQGGSGITQQYVKNAYLNSERTLTRKLKELAIAVKLDRHYSKDQILEWYLNTIYFGRGAYGIEAASEAYFKTSVDKLTVSQGAMLAGLIQAPSYYDPATAKVAAEQRWNYVLDGMVSIHHLDPATRAKEVFPATVKATATQLGATGPEGLIVTQVKAELEKDGISEAQLNTQGLKIQTTIDQSAQRDAESSIKSVYGKLTAQQKKDKLREAMVSVNPKTGGVLAYYGGSDPTGYDYAQAWRAPGSSFKPFTLAAVLQANLAGAKPAYSLNSLVDGSQPAKLPGLPPIVNDPGDAGFSHVVSIQQAMTVSLNTAFARLAQGVGPAKVAAAAHTAGIPLTMTRSAGVDAGTKTLQLNGTTNASIGYGSYRVRPIDQASAMATFANGGIEHDSYFVQKVTDANGKVLYEHKDNGKRVFDAKIANDVAVSMKDVASWSNDPLNGGRPSGAKTGTVGLTGANDGNSDAWMVGFTPQASTAVWTGNDQTSVPVVNKDGVALYGSNMPGQAWKLFMDTYLGGKAVLPLPTKAQITNGSNQSSSNSPSKPPPSTDPKTTPPSTTPPSTTPPTKTPPTTTPPTKTPPTTTPPTKTPPTTPPGTGKSSKPAGPGG